MKFKIIKYCKSKNNQKYKKWFKQSVKSNYFLILTKIKLKVHN